MLTPKGAVRIKLILLCFCFFYHSYSRFIHTISIITEWCFLVIASSSLYCLWVCLSVGWLMCPKGHVSLLTKSNPACPSVCLSFHHTFGGNISFSLKFHEIYRKHSPRQTAQDISIFLAVSAKFRPSGPPKIAEISGFWPLSGILYIQSASFNTWYVH